MAKRLYLIDGHAMIYRAFYAVEGLTAPDGRPTGAALGFTRMLLNTIRDHEPDYLIAVFDAPGKTFRHKMYNEYKATRKPTPPELIEQVPLIQEIVEALRIPIFTLEGYEADDLIGTLTRQGRENDVEVVVVSGDKDCAQLLEAGVSLYDPQRKRTTTVESFVEKKGIRPDQLTDLMGLWGDTSDNIPGVPGIGEKTGATLIKQYETLEDLLDRAGEIKGKRGQSIRDNAEQARLSKDLATIRCDAPIELNLSLCERHDPDAPHLVKLFNELGFKSLLRDLDLGPKKKEEHDYILVDTAEKLDALLTSLTHVDHIALDTETTALDPMQAELVGISLSWAPNTAYYLPFRGPDGETILNADALDRIKPIIENPKITKTGQNLKYDALVLAGCGIEVKGIVFDTLIASSILAGHLRTHDLDTLAERHLGYKKIPTSDLIGSGTKQITMDAVPVAEVCTYACEDADISLRLETELADHLDKRNATKLMRELELPLSFVLTEMQQTGIRVDCTLLARQSEETGRLLDGLTEEIHELAGREFNIASPKQLGEILFDELGLPVIRRTKTGPSTDEAVLHELASQGHELPARVVEYRMYAKLKNTYIDALPKLVNPKTGRIHTTFSQTTTATGRLSSRDPNLQNIPVRTAHGRAIRAAFIPEDGWTMLAADYSQVELRMLAHYSGDEVLRKAFADGKDIHRVVAAEVNGVGEGAVTSEQRSSAKAVNFGIIYGQTAHGLSQTTGMALGRARDFIEDYFARFPRIKDFIDATIAQAHENGYVETMLGRRREIPELKSSKKNIAARAEREAVNTVIQGSAADLIKRAMIDLRRRMREETPESRMLLQIHDELVFESPASEIERLASIVRDQMEHALPLEVPLTVEMGRGNNWLEVK